MVNAPERICAWPAGNAASTSIFPYDEDTDSSGLVEYVRADVAASLSRTGAVKVKALTPWRRGYCDDQVKIEQASFGGLYQVRVLNGVINLDWPDRAPSSVFASVDAAKAAAQADYERRILSALEPAAPEGQQKAAEAERARKGMDRILREQSERDIPFAPEDMANEPEASEIAKQKEGE